MTSILTKIPLTLRRVLDSHDAHPNHRREPEKPQVTHLLNDYPFPTGPHHLN